MVDSCREGRGREEMDGRRGEGREGEGWGGGWGQVVVGGRVC